jgi:hypothetical protein
MVKIRALVVWPHQQGIYIMLYAFNLCIADYLVPGIFSELSTRCFFFSFCLSKKKQKGPRIPRLTGRAGIYNTNTDQALIKLLCYCSEQRQCLHNHLLCVA